MALAKRVPLSRELVLTALAFGALFETPWTVSLGWRRPRHYVANHWDLAWVGLDSAQVLMLLASAWAAWRRRAILIVFLCASATLLLVDAWFDVTTARYDEVAQSVVAIAIEVPSAIVLFGIALLVVKWLAHPGLDGVDVAAPSAHRILIPPRAPESPVDVTQS